MRLFFLVFSLFVWGLGLVFFSVCFFVLSQGGVVWIGGLDLLREAFGVYPDNRQGPNTSEMLKIIRQTVLPHKLIESVHISK